MCLLNEILNINLGKVTVGEEGEECVFFIAILKWISKYKFKCVSQEVYYLAKIYVKEEGDKGKSLNLSEVKVGEEIRNPCSLYLIAFCSITYFTITLFEFVF